MNILAEMLHAIYDFKSYPRFMKNKPWKVILYGFLLSTLYVLLTTVLPAASMLAAVGGVQNLIEGAVPDFSLTDGILQVEEPIEYKIYDDYQGGIYLKVDTSSTIVDDITDVDLLAFDRAVIADSEKILVKERGDIFRLSFAEAGLGNWTRGMLLDELLPYIEMAVWAVVLLFFVIEISSFFAGALFVASVGAFIASAMRYSIKFGALYKLAVYTRTLPTLLKTVSAWVPIMMPFFYLLNFGVSIFYIWKVLNILKSQEETPQRPIWTGEP